MGDPELFLAIARMLERLVVDLIGGLAVYFGYRLFVTLPTQTTQSGKIALPGMSVTLSRVGPGVFFVAFGTVVLYASFQYPISIEPGGKFSGATARPVQPQDVARAAGAIQTLNCLEKSAKAPGRRDWNAESEIAIRDAKVALLSGVWDEKAWGKLDAFRRWAESGTGTVPPGLAQIYRDAGPCRMR